MENWKNWLNCRTKLPIGSVGRCVSPSPKDLEWVHHPKSKHFDHFFLNFTFHIRWRGPRNWKCPFLIKWMHLFPSDWLWFILRRFHIYWSKMKKTAVTTRLSCASHRNQIWFMISSSSQLNWVITMPPLLRSLKNFTELNVITFVFFFCLPCAVQGIEKKRKHNI